jgi:hypothetical protein
LATHPVARRDKPQLADMSNSSNVYLEPTHHAGRRFFSRDISGPVVMLNLLRLRDIADYSATPSLAPHSPISGREAYDRYVAHTLPHLRESGGEIVFLGDAGDYLIGPPTERWDLVMLVRHRSPQTFLAFASNEAYLGGMGHRLAAIEDSRLLPVIESRVAGRS